MAIIVALLLLAMLCWMFELEKKCLGLEDCIRERDEEHMEEKRREEMFLEGLQNIFNYGGERRELRPEDLNDEQERI